GVLAYDEFALSTMAMQPPPWCRGANNWTPCRWADCDDVRAAEWLQCEGIDVPVGVAASAIETVAHDNSFHPIRDYLRAEGRPYLLAARIGRDSGVALCACRCDAHVEAW